MAIYTELPVYKESYDLLLQTYRLVHNLGKEYKYNLGDKIKNETTDLLTNIYKANKTFEKVIFLDAGRQNIELIRLYLRILKDLNQIGLAQFVSINETIESVSKQITGWHKKERQAKSDK